MKRLLALLLFTASPAYAQTASLGTEFGQPLGLTHGSGFAQCSNQAALPYQQCVHVPGNVQSAYGTLTIKRSYIEVLAYLVCNGVVIWQGESVGGTVPISVPHLPAGISGSNCWVQWDEINANWGTAIRRGGDWEYQITVSGGGQ